MKKFEDLFNTNFLIEQNPGGSVNPRDVNLLPFDGGMCGGTEENSSTDWNWREHTPDENRLRGLEMDQRRREQSYKNARDLTLHGKPTATSTGKDTEEYKAAQELMNAIQQKKTPEEIAKLASVAREKNEIASETRASERSIERSSDKISPMYWVTYGDFKTATGEDYDLTDPRHRQIFFDLNSRGGSTVSPTAGVGQGPAYDSLEYHTMRRRPKDIPPATFPGVNLAGNRVQYRNPDALYDTETGIIAPTTGQSRARVAREEAPKDLEYGMAKREQAFQDAMERRRNEIIQKDATDKLLNRNANFWKNVYDQDNLTKQRRLNTIYELERELGKDNVTGYDDTHILPREERRKPIVRGLGVPINQGMDAIADAAKNMGIKVSDFIKMQLMTPNLWSDNIKLYGSPEGNVPFPYVQRGQYPQIDGTTVNTGGMNQPMELPDPEEMVSLPDEDGRIVQRNVPFTIQQLINLKKLEKQLRNSGINVSDFIKKQLMQPNLWSDTEKLYGDVINPKAQMSNMQRGQYPIESSGEYTQIKMPYTYIPGQDYDLSRRLKRFSKFSERPKD